MPLLENSKTHIAILFRDVARSENPEGRIVFRGAIGVRPARLQIECDSGGLAVSRHAMVVLTCPGMRVGGAPGIGWG